MRPFRTARAVAIILTVGVCAVPAASSGDVGQFVATVRCNEVVLHSKTGSGSGYRAVLGAVSAPPRYIPRIVTDASSAPFSHWSKAGLWIRAGNTVVTVSLPKEWQGKARIVWGAPGTPATAVRFGPCPSEVATWDGYAGGFLLRAKSACLPLIFSVGDRRTTLRFGVGQRC